jgi:hypothetical protein
LKLLLIKTLNSIRLELCPHGLITSQDLISNTIALEVGASTYAFLGGHKHSVHSTSYGTAKPTNPDDLDLNPNSVVINLL